MRPIRSRIRDDEGIAAEGVYVDGDDGTMGSYCTEVFVLLVKEEALIAIGHASFLSQSVPLLGVSKTLPRSKDLLAKVKASSQ